MTVADYFFLAPVSAQGGTQDDGANVKVQAVFRALPRVGSVQVPLSALAPNNWVLVGDCSSSVFHTCIGKGQSTNTEQSFSCVRLRKPDGDFVFCKPVPSCPGLDVEKVRVNLSFFALTELS